MRCGQNKYYAFTAHVIKNIHFLIYAIDKLCTGKGEHVNGSNYAKALAAVEFIAVTLTF